MATTEDRPPSGTCRVIAVRAADNEPAFTLHDLTPQLADLITRLFEWQTPELRLRIEPENSSPPQPHARPE